MPPSDAMTNLERDFLLAALKLHETKIAQQGAGSTFQAISGKQLREFRIPYPPLAEQKRIVAILTEQMVAAEAIRTAAEERLEAAGALHLAFSNAVFESTEALTWTEKAIGVNM